VECQPGQADLLDQPVGAQPCEAVRTLAGGRGANVATEVVGAPAADDVLAADVEVLHRHLVSESLGEGPVGDLDERVVGERAGAPATAEGGRPGAGGH
jgi:hypothetical protein